MKSKTNCFNCQITLNNLSIHDKNYITLKDIADELGLTYNVVADISSGRKKNHSYLNFKYQPKIEITRINKNKKECLKNHIIDNTEDY